MLELNKNKIIDQKFILAYGVDETSKEVNNLLSEGYVIKDMKCAGAGDCFFVTIIYLVKYDDLTINDLTIG